MKTLNFPITSRRKHLKDFLVLAVIIAVLGITGYLTAANWQFLFESFSKLPAGLFVFVGEEEDKERAEKNFLDNLEKLEEKPDKYAEKAEKGEGLTHLARRALNKYLQENFQDFEVTAEHKVYAEDYIVKKLGSGWLELGQEVEISVELIEEAINSSAELSPEQLDNLTQYSELVSF